MTDYNDGKIHGWNGGECPVHPKTWVRYWLRDQGMSQNPAGILDWQHDDVSADIIAFRVVKEYREPKTIWVNEYKTGMISYHTEGEAKRAQHPAPVRIAVKYQEVIKND